MLVKSHRIVPGERDRGFIWTHCSSVDDIRYFDYHERVLARIGTLFLAYDLLGRENGPLRWFTFVITCGLVSALARIQCCRELSAITMGFRNTRRLRGYDQFISGHHLVGALALSNATAGSIAQYTLWRANSLPHHVWGAFGLVLLLVSFGLQGVQPLINILNGVK
jgi:hypothetical protein